MENKTKILIKIVLRFFYLGEELTRDDFLTVSSDIVLGFYLVNFTQPHTVVLSALGQYR